MFVDDLARKAGGRGAVTLGVDRPGAELWRSGARHYELIMTPSAYQAKIGGFCVSPPSTADALGPAQRPA